jgi:hypothetical protein
MRHSLSAALLLTVACAAFLVPNAAAKTPGKVTRIDASCAGDLIRGKAKVDAPAMLSLQLFKRRSPSSKFYATKRLAWIRARAAGAYKFSFDVSKLTANAYRVRATRYNARSRVLLSSTCAPGYQVPEAPLTILLPLSLLAALGLWFGYGRLRRRSALGGS